MRVGGKARRELIVEAGSMASKFYTEWCQEVRSVGTCVIVLEWQLQTWGDWTEKEGGRA